jgi:hypothetical protein
MDVTSNPIVVTAADVAAAAVTVWKGKLLITNIIFMQYLADTDTCTINQGNGKLFAYLTGDTDFDIQRTGDVRHADGLVVPHGGITNGMALIYHR